MYLISANQWWGILIVKVEANQANLDTNPQALGERISSIATISFHQHYWCPCYPKEKEVLFLLPIINTITSSYLVENKRCSINALRLYSRYCSSWLWVVLKSSFIKKCGYKFHILVGQLFDTKRCNMKMIRLESH